MLYTKCNSTRVLFLGFGNGDPHIRTLDGKTYTFNGRGEYTLIEILNTGFTLQGRTEPVSNTSNATQFSAFAMGINDEGLSAEVTHTQVFMNVLTAIVFCVVVTLPCVI